MHWNLNPHPGKIKVNVQNVRHLCDGEGPQAAATHALHSGFVPTLCGHQRPSPHPPTLASDEGSLYLLHSLDWQAHLMTIKRREQLGSFNTLNNIPHQLTYMRDGSDIWEQTIQEF